MNPKPSPNLKKIWTIEEPFYAQVGPAFLYPLRGFGPYVLAGGWAYCMVVVGGVVLAPWFWLFLLPLFGYVICFLNLVLERSAAGKDLIPTWSDVPSDSGLWEAFLEGVLALLAALLPVIWIPWVIPTLRADPVAQSLMSFLTLGIFAFLFPMCYLSATLAGIWSAFAYPHILRSISVSRLSYGFCFVVSLAMLAFFGAAIRLVTTEWILGAAPLVLLTLYLAIVLARLLGVYYRACRREFAWFDRL